MASRSVIARAVPCIGGRIYSGLRGIAILEFADLTKNRMFAGARLSTCQAEFDVQEQLTYGNTRETH
jgi:hypothetical protein